MNVSWAWPFSTLVLTGVRAFFLPHLACYSGLAASFSGSDAGQITLYVRAPSNSRLDATERRVVEVEKFWAQHSFERA